MLGMLGRVRSMPCLLPTWVRLFVKWGGVPTSFLILVGCCLERHVSTSFAAWFDEFGDWRQCRGAGGGMHR